MFLFGKKPEEWEDGVTDRSSLGRNWRSLHTPTKGFRKTTLTSYSHLYEATVASTLREFLSLGCCTAPEGNRQQEKPRGGEGEKSKQAK